MYIHTHTHIYIYTILDSLSAARQSFLFLSEPRRGESNHFATSLGSMNFSFNERRTRIGRLVFLMRFRRIVRNAYACLNRATQPCSLNFALLIYPWHMLKITLARGSKYYEFLSSLQIDKLVSIRISVMEKGRRIYRKFYTAICIFDPSIRLSIYPRSNC